MYRQESMCICGVIRLESDFVQLDIFLPDEIEHLKVMYEKYPKEFWARDFNLFNIYKCMIPRKMSVEDVDFFRGISNKIKQRIDYKQDAAHYFLKYVKDSFTNVHIDNPKRIKRTAVTLLDISADIIGGDTLLIKNIQDSDIGPGNQRPEGLQDRSNLRVPSIVKPKIGSTLIYNHNVRHGVTKVEQGHRLVLISWFS